MIREAIILAGGLGTRLRDTVPGLPKCLAPVAGRPFLFHVINQLRREGVEKFVFALGYRHELIQAYLAEAFPTLRYQVSIEYEPLGTGGAILQACTLAAEKQVVVANGDTLFRASLDEPALFHRDHLGECTLLLKPMRNFDRYGVVETGDDSLVKGFREKQRFEEGNINAGLYLLDRNRFLDEEFPEKFSFEKDYLERMHGQRRIYGRVQDSYFIDIGVPEDYARAQTELARPPLQLDQADQSWTLLLDRDGVINYEKKDDYIRSWEEFRFYEGVPESWPALSRRFGRVIIVSNQRGVGRGLMTEGDLRGIHEHMTAEIEKAGGRVDHIFYCTSTDSYHPDRKPNPGMAFLAARHFPGIDLDKTIIAGNKMSDMQFGRHAGIYTVFVATTHPETPWPHPDVDLRVNSLPELAGLFRP